MPKPKKHKWTFRARFRTNTFGWRGTKLARQRLKEAISEIKKAGRKDPVLAADGAVMLIERLWPALQGIDGSSGALGTAVDKTVDTLLPIIVEAPADRKTRDEWLDRLWEAYQEDGVDFTRDVADRWGDLCGSAEVASKWADDLLPGLRESWSSDRKRGSYFRGTRACLSAMLAAGRHQELLDLIETAPVKRWANRKFGVKALVAMGKTAEALRYAERSSGLNDRDQPIAEACEEILLSSGLADEAYERYAFRANVMTSRLSTFRAVAKKYPKKDKEQILADLIASTPSSQGKWFAAAKSLGLLDLAADLSKKSPCDPKTLNRAARDHVESNPEFSFEVGIASIHWIAEGWGFEIMPRDVILAYQYANKAAEVLGRQQELVERLREAVAGGPAGKWVRDVLGRRIEQR